MKFEVCDLCSFSFSLLMKQLVRPELNNSSHYLNPDLCDAGAGALLYQLSDQANCKDHMLQLLLHLQFKYMIFTYQNHI